MSTKSSKSRRKRRSPEEMIRDLELEIVRIKEAQKAKASPAHKQARNGLRALEKALALAADEQDPELEQALSTAIGALAECFGEPAAAGTRKRRSSEELADVAERLVEFLRENPRSTIGAIADALDESPKELRGPLAVLIEEGRVRKEGERRGTRYFVGGKRSRKAS